MSTNADTNTSFPPDGELQTCTQCQAQMLREMRFCRNCGYRFGEGVAEYTETRRFDAINMPQAVTTTPLPPANPTNPAWGYLPPQQPIAPVATWQPRTQRRGRHWMVWVIISVVASSALSGALFSGAGKHRISVNKRIEPPRSYVGVNQFDTAKDDSGATFDTITPPGSAADKAGLVGGDVIVSFDGQPVANRDQMMKLLGATPIGKTVDVVYLRDGERKTTKMTTVSEDENKRLDNEFRHQEHGFLGVDDLDRVIVPGTNIYGVRVGDVNGNGPAYLAGLKEGDIIVELNGTPIRTTDELGMRIDRTPPLSVAKVVLMRGPENGPLEKITLDIKVGKDR